MADVTLNFSGRDFTAEYQRLVEMLRVEMPEYTDLNHADPGIAILRLVARQTDQLNAVLDRIAAAGFLDHAQFRQDLIRLGTLVGYAPTLASAASTRLRITRVEAGSGVIAIPRHTSFTRSDGLGYLTVDAVSIQAAEESVEVNAVQGTVVESTVSAADLRTIDRSGRRKALPGRSVAAGTIEVSHGDPPQSWTVVESLWRSKPTDRHVVLELDGDTDEVWLVFGDGNQGAPLPDGVTLNVRFVRTDAARGNCGHSVIYGVPEALTGIVTVTNIEPAVGGAASETTASIRRNLPRCVRAQRRGVTKADYEALISHLPGILHVQVLDRNDSRDWPHDHVAIFVVPAGGGMLSTYLRDLIWNECGQWGHLGPWRGRYIVRDAVRVPCNVSVRFGVMEGYSSDAVRSGIQDAVSNILAIEQQMIGGGVKFWELHETASIVPGAAWVEFDQPKQDVIVNAGENLICGAVIAIAQ